MVKKTHKLSTDEIFSSFQQNAQNSGEVKTTVYSQYIQAITSDKYKRETKASLTSQLLTFYEEQGLISLFNKAFKTHKNELIKNSILFQFWNTKALEIGGRYAAMQKASVKLLNISLRNGNNKNTSDAYRLIATSQNACESQRFGSVLCEPRIEFRQEVKLKECRCLNL